MRVIAEPFVRRQLRRRAAAIATQHSVDQCSAASDEIQLAVGTLRLNDDRLGVVEARSVVKLTVDPHSRNLQESRLMRQREVQLTTEIESAQLAALRDEIFIDRRTTLPWLMLRFPELATVEPGEVITEILKQSDEHRKQNHSPPADERQQAMTELVGWLTSDDTSGSQAALQALDFVLEKLGENHLRQRLRVFDAPVP